MSLSDKTFTFQRLKGQSNYEIWSLRMWSYLTEKGYIQAIEDPSSLEETAKELTIAKALSVIRLAVEDGPLLQIQHANTAKEA